MSREMILADKNGALPFLLEETAFEGVRRIAGKVAADVEKVCGVLPKVRTLQAEEALSGAAVFCGTLGRSALLDRLAEQGKLDISKVQGKREVYSLQLVAQPFDGVEQALIVCGSDKRGTIYGLFRISELLGVSPLVYWGDVEPLKKESFAFTEAMEMVSKEPSVKFRGFFINDEWPCFGNWTFSHFGGFTAEMYDHVFELLLRLKGNYMWPAMWTSSFALDGPGSLNEELADMYGVVVGYSHHEPCLRSSEEWDKVRGEDSIYGNEWNYYTNSEGLSRYWADSLKRSGKYEHLITIGMRGERDSSMLGDNASLKDNIDLLKDIIKKQRELIGQYVNEDVDSVPQLLALYKEVEAYFYGDENTEGLKEWEELKNVIFMLCEDNFGQMRTLPQGDMKKHLGGYGMYYHLDYHGSPVSYEWMPTMQFAKIWEQMTEAYEYGIHDVWIVNVGDLKGNEVALQYFLSLAYDFEKWGSKAPGSWEAYTAQWIADTFPGVSKELQTKMAEVYTGFADINAMRRPEALHAGIYNPCHYGETDDMLARAEAICEKNETVYAALDGAQKDAYYSLIYFPAKISMNLLNMHLSAGKNAHYAMQGRKAANLWAARVTECLAEDKRLVEEFGAFRGGKWKGMELERHIGFTKWNDDGWRNPLRIQVEPVDKPRMSVSRWDEEAIAVKNYGTPICIPVHEFLYPSVTESFLEISNDGEGLLPYEIKIDNAEKALPAWLGVSSMKGEVETLEVITLTCNRELLPKEEQCVRLLISDGDATVAVEVKGKRDALVDETGAALPENTFVDRDGMIVMEANHYCAKKDTDKGAYTYLPGYGRSLNGMKVLPSTAVYTEDEEKPSLTYRFVLPAAGEYAVEIWTAPVNALKNREPLRIELAAGNEKKLVEILDASYRGGDPRDESWCADVLNQVRVTKTAFSFEKGLQELTVAALEAGETLERILIYPAEKSLKKSYLGPKETYRV